MTTNRAYLEQLLSDIPRQRAMIDALWPRGSDLWSYEMYELRRIEEYLRKWLAETALDNPATVEL